MNAIKRGNASWHQMPRKTQQRLLNGISAFVATMIVVVATSGLHGYWHAFLLGLCSVLELGVIVLQIRIGRQRPAQ
ncbi:MAG: hypothetical protein ACYCOU_25380 [Sulfobacillus sp.]